MRKDLGLPRSRRRCHDDRRPLGDFRNRGIVEMEVDRAFVGDAPNAIDEWHGI